MKTTVIYHSADFDGLFCREIARKFLPNAELIGWDFGDKPLMVPHDGQIYVMDLPIDRFFGFEFHQDGDRHYENWKSDSNPDRMTQCHKMIKERLIWIDHHKSAIESHPKDIPGYRIDGVAACRLAWQWFTMVDGNTREGDVGNSVRAAGVLPMIQDFKNRQVNEPLAVRLAGEYDIWDKRDPNAELFQHGLKSEELYSTAWDDMLDVNGGGTVTRLLNQGRALQFARANEYRDVITQQGFDLQFEGLTFLACNSHELDIRSHLFEAGIKPHHDALLGFTFTGQDWRISFYHIDGKKDRDILSIAKKYGGGHAGACGCRPKTLPFTI